MFNTEEKIFSLIKKREHKILNEIYDKETPVVHPDMKAFDSSLLDLVKRFAALPGVACLKAGYDQDHYCMVNQSISFVINEEGQHILRNYDILAKNGFYAIRKHAINLSIAGHGFCDMGDIFPLLTLSAKYNQTSSIMIDARRNMWLSLISQFESMKHV